MMRAGVVEVKATCMPAGRRWENGSVLLVANWEAMRGHGRGCRPLPMVGNAACLRLSGAILPGSCSVLCCSEMIQALVPASSPVLQSLAAVPFFSIVIVLLIWMFISFPLCLFGTVVGRNWAGAPDHPCRYVAAPLYQPPKMQHASSACQLLCKTCLSDALRPLHFI